MSASRQEFNKFGFARTFVLPALLVFLVPVVSLLFFYHAQQQFDAKARTAVLQQINADASMSAEDRAAAVAFFTATPFSTLIMNEKFAANLDATTRFNYATFRWMIRLSVLSIIGGITVFILAVICVLLSLRSQMMQYLSLLAGWHLLRLYAALQTIVVGILVVALSFWVTALWFNMYSIKLIGIAAIIAVVGVFMVIAAIFKRPDSDNNVEAVVLDRDSAAPLWDELKAICEKVGTSPPDQVIAGIDDNFFVTEQPVSVEGKLLRGKTLYVSLPLLKQMHAAEADAVLAHEMAHFSGNDTLYSKRISPLLQRYSVYLHELRNGMISVPAFYLMACFRALFELSLSKLSRDREIRADRISAETTSPTSFSGAMLRIAAYSKFRQSIEHDLFQRERALERANVSDQIEGGFRDFTLTFAADPEIGRIETAHPFDSHPPLTQRLAALGISLTVEDAQSLLATPGDGGWYRRISNAEASERSLWGAYEERFRKYHEETLPYRFLPETAEEQAIVENTFPPQSFTGSEGRLVIDFEKVQFSPWAEPIRYSEITRCALHDQNGLEIHYHRLGNSSRTIYTKKFGNEQAAVLAAFERYYGRYLAAVAYRQQFKSSPPPDADTAN